MNDEEVKPDPKRPWFDPACAILMAISSLMTAWCSYQNSQWSGLTSDLEGRADKREREAMAMHLEASQTKGAHLTLVMEVIDNKLEGREKQAEFYLARFPTELKAAWDKWMESKPFDPGSAAPAHPILPDFYEHPSSKDIRAAMKDAHDHEDRARITGGHAGTYLGNTVLLATVLFFAGTAGKFDHHRVRWSSLVFALSLFTFAAWRTAMLPVA